VAAPPLHKDEVHTCLGNSILSANNRQMVSRLWEPLYVGREATVSLLDDGACFIR
jgi:hypothetical protein